MIESSSSHPIAVSVTIKTMSNNILAENVLPTLVSMKSAEIGADDFSNTNQFRNPRTQRIVILSDREMRSFLTVCCDGNGAVVAEETAKPTGMMERMRRRAGA